MTATDVGQDVTVELAGRAYALHYDEDALAAAEASLGAPLPAMAAVLMALPVNERLARIYGLMAPGLRHAHTPDGGPFTTAWLMDNADPAEGPRHMETVAHALADAWRQAHERRIARVQAEMNDIVLDVRLAEQHARGLNPPPG